MKKLMIISIFFLLAAIANGQKKLVPVTQSLLTGISLPEGAKQDNRGLSIMSAKILMEMETKKKNITASTTEVLIIPSVNNNDFNEGILTKKLTDLGWIVTVNTDDKKYAWLQKGSQNMVMYFSKNQKESELYFAVTSSSPSQNSSVNHTQQNQTVTTTNNQTAPGSNTSTHNTQQPAKIKEPTTSGFAFTTTNFDDGWTSTVQQDWVEAIKGNIKVLIHYPNKNADAYSSDLMEGLKHAWNVLVAPKYSSATNMEFKPLYNWQSIEFAEASMVEKVTGKTVYVVFFKKHFNSGAGKYIEFISTDKNSFEKEFGAYTNEALAASWDKMAAMANYNKFAVAASDLNGKWTSNFTGMTQYVNAYTGADAGANTHASNENFEFGVANTYKWDLGVASGFVGNIKFQSVKSSGNFTMLNNWQVKFSDIEGKPKTYNVQFVCIKGARILWIGETGFGKKE